jgi:hypothetical protein
VDDQSTFRCLIWRRTVQFCNHDVLELQLKPTHKPYEIRQSWRALVAQYSHASYNRQQRDEPKVMFQRNIFFPQHLEEKIKWGLYGTSGGEHCKLVLQGPEDSRVALRGGQTQRIGREVPMRSGSLHHAGRHPSSSRTGSLQSPNPFHSLLQRGTVEVFTPPCQEELDLDLVAHQLEKFSRSQTSGAVQENTELRHQPEVDEEVFGVLLVATVLRVLFLYCQLLIFARRSAFFEGQIEQPVRGLTSLITYQDIPVLVAINSKGVYIIDDSQCVSKLWR